jgi:drug/metabolite transporter (DMT)-like permease
VSVPQTATLPASDHLVATGCVVAEMLLATLSNVLLRLAATDVTPEMTLFLRLLIASAILLPLVCRNSTARSEISALFANRRRLWRYVLCGVVSYIASIAWLHALLKLPLAIATSLFFTTALFMGAIGRWVLAEPFTMRHWLTLGAGLIGVVIVLQPSFVPIPLTGVIAALVAAALAALGKAQLKSLSGPETPALSAFLRLAPVIPFAALPALRSSALPSLEAASEIVAAAGLLVIGHVAIAKGYILFRLSQAAALEYLRLLFATVAGILVFSEPVGAATLIGGAVILLAALVGTNKPLPNVARSSSGS